MNGNTFRVLEFERVRALLTRHAGSASGKRLVAALKPEASLDAVRAALSRTTQAVRLLDDYGRQPYHDLPDLTESLVATQVEGLHLEPAALLDVASFARGASEIGGHVARAASAPALAGLTAEIADFSDLSAAIERAVLPSLELADDASPRLAEIRRGMASLRAQLHSVMDCYLRDRDAERLLQDKLVTTRNDRYVLLVKAEQRGRLPGIVHGGSGSGQSLYVEPLPAVELNNDIVAMADEERAEVLRILRELTSRAALRRAELARARDVLGELDALQAMALAARDMGAHEPEVFEWDQAAADTAGGAPLLELRDARHPLLMPQVAERLGIPRRTSREPVPVTLRLGFDTPVLVISGPNTGGKTVALKTIGLFALMAQSGLHLPAAPGSRLPVFRRIYADVGDDQSISESLSTFSAHLATIVEMTRDLTAPALVLLDEVGAGTDPTEGGGLAVAIVDHFRAQGALVVATTHHGLMKAYAQSTPEVACASFGYDPRSYAPTYRLAVGEPGRSLALEMAERLGLPPGVVSDARSRLSLKEAQAEAMLKELEAERRRLSREADELEARRRDLDAERAALSAAEAALEARKGAELQAFSRALQRRGELVARQAADAIKEAAAELEATRRRVETEARALTARQAANLTARVRSTTLARIREAQTAALTPDPDTQGPPTAASPTAWVGRRARVKGLGVVGQVLALHEGQAELAVGGKRLRVPVEELFELGGTAGRADPSPSARITPPATSSSAAALGSAAGPAEINVIGCTVDEALPRVDKFLDESSLSERRQVRVIHGFGQGRLRRAVAELLEDHPHVATFRLGGAKEGGAGATIVELRD